MALTSSCCIDFKLWFIVLFESTCGATKNPCHCEPVRTLLRAKSRRTAAVALCTGLRA